MANDMSAAEVLALIQVAIAREARDAANRGDLDGASECMRRLARQIGHDDVSGYPADVQLALGYSPPVATEPVMKCEPRFPRRRHAVLRSVDTRGTIVTYDATTRAAVLLIAAERAAPSDALDLVRSARSEIEDDHSDQAGALREWAREIAQRNGEPIEPHPMALVGQFQVVDSNLIYDMWAREMYDYRTGRPVHDAWAKADLHRRSVAWAGPEHQEAVLADQTSIRAAQTKHARSHR